MKETGWSEDYILDMPYSKLMGYKHSILNSYDCDCRWITTQTEKAELMDLFSKL